MTSNKIITEQYCQQILENYLKCSEFEIIDFTVTSLANKVTGMMAEYYTLKIQFKVGENTETKQFFCKKLSMFHKIQEIMGKAQGAYDKEDFIYNFLITKCNKIPNYNINIAPKCYLSMKDELFVLEDLSELGYKVRSNLHDLSHCKTALKTIAKFHASSIIYEEQLSIAKGSKYSLNSDYRHIFQDSLFRKDENYLGRHWFKNCNATIAKLIDLSPVNTIKLKDKLQFYSEKVYEIVKPSSVYNNVICHGDLSLSNLMFKYDPITNLPIDCKLIDFQALRYNPPAHDVVAYIYLTTDPDFRLKHLNELLEWYYVHFHRELDEHCVNKDNHIILEMFRETCDYVLPLIVLQAAFYATMLPMEDYPHIKNDQDLYKKYVYDDRSHECIAAYNKGGVFKEMIDDLLRAFSDL